MDIFHAIDTITRRQSTTNGGGGGGGSTSSQFLNLISDPFESSVSRRFESALGLFTDLNSFKQALSGPR
jgi:hypothetical protein